MTLANMLTMGRLASVPVIVMLLLVKDPLACVAAMGVLGLASISDAYDGHLARTRNEITPFGTFMDPLVDKVLVLTLLGMFAGLQLIEWWMYGVIAVREVVVTVARWFDYRGGADVSARMLGKQKTAWQLVVIFILMTLHTLKTLRASMESSWRMLADERAMAWLSWTASGLMWVVVILSVASGVQIFLHRRRP